MKKYALDKKVLKSIRCSNCKEGLMFSNSSKLATALGVFYRECDTCHCKEAVKVNKEV